MDFEPGSIKQAARALLGEPNAQLSKPDELRYGSHGSLSIDLEKNTFFDHEKNEGGGLLDLVQRETKARSKKAAMQWLQKNGFAPFEATAPIKAKVVAVYDYKGGTGELLFQVQRFEPKKFTQRRPDGNGWKYSVKGVRQVPYRLPELLTAPPHKTVYIVEGEKDADRLASLGLVATCNAGGAGKWRAAHAAYFKDRTVIVIPDNDNAGRNHAQKVAKSLKGIAAHVRILELPDLPEKGDVSDWLDAGGTAEKLVALPSKAAEVTSDTDEEDEGRKPSQTDMLVTFAREKFDLLHDSNGDVFAKDKTTAEVRRLGGRSFKDRLISGFYEKTEIAVRDQALREALGTLQALGRFNGETQAVHIRVAKHEDSYFLDLCEPGNSRAVELCAGSWRIVDAPPVMFVRGDAMQPLPTPVHGGQLAPLWQVANVPPALQRFVIAWLIDAMRPETPHPGLELVGEQGSGKSTAAEALRRVIDPNACNLRGAPKTVEDIFVAAGQSHIVAYENVSHLAGPMQDALAILSTGGGFSKRQLYSDAEEHIINVRRPWLVNGITIAVTQQDLVDRVISIECPVIATRQASSQQWVDFAKALPGILGGLLDIAAKALAALPAMRLAPTDRPRLMEYVLLGMATAQAMGGKPEDFLKGFRELRAETVARTLDASPVAAAVMEFVEKSPAGATTTVKDLLARLEDYKPTGAEAWPRSPKGLGDALRRAAPALRQLDVDCRCLGKGSGGVVRWVVQKKVLESKSQKSQVPNMSELIDPEKLGLGTFGTLQPEVSLVSGVSL
jgi:Toprim-like